VLRSAADINADIARARLEKPFARSKGCTEVTLEESRALCKALAKLDAERAKVAEAAEISGKLAATNIRLGGIDAAAAIRPADPQAQSLANLITPVHTVSPEGVRTALAVLIALLIEIGSGLGPWLLSGRRVRPEAPAAAVEEAPGPDEVAPEAPPDSAEQPEHPVAAWLEDATYEHPGAEIPALDLLKACNTWLEKNGDPPVERTALGTELRRLGYEKVRRKGKTLYCGIAMRPPKRARLVVSNG
jgi:hypothetical protein